MSFYKQQLGVSGKEKLFNLKNCGTTCSGANISHVKMLPLTGGQAVRRQRLRDLALHFTAVLSHSSHIRVGQSVETAAEWHLSN